jgi:hypothetical protein
VFLLAWVIRLADRLTAQAPAYAAAPGLPAPVPVPAGVPAGPLTFAQAPVVHPPAGGSRAPGRTGTPLAPRCAALCSMAMGITMGYMLITML